MHSNLISFLQASQLSWHGKNDVLMWSVLLSVLCAAAVRHLQEASASQQKSSLAATAVCWICISVAAAVTFRYAPAQHRSSIRLQPGHTARVLCSQGYALSLPLTYITCLRMLTRCRLTCGMQSCATVLAQILSYTCRTGFWATWNLEFLPPSKCSESSTELRAQACVLLMRRFSYGMYRRAKALAHIPGPKPQNWFLGYMELAYTQQPHRLCTALAEIHGPIFKFRMLCFHVSCHPQWRLLGKAFMQLLKAVFSVVRSGVSLRPAH